ncbi:hypothetical protein LCGC14_1696940, partial [marine sediment metagenome]
VSGEGQLGILGIGEGPGKNEDKKGIQFIGEAGRLWQKYLDPHGIDIHRDMHLDNGVQCRPPGNRKPTSQEVSYCRNRVRNNINQLRPKFIWLLGETAVRSFYGTRFRNLTIARWHRLCIPDQQTGAWVIPLYHPSFALRANKDKNKVAMFERDLEFAVSCLNLPPPQFTDPASLVTVVTDYNQIIEWLDWLLECAEQYQFAAAIDFETSNLKPMYSSAQKIWTCSIATSGTQSVSFPISYTGHLMHEQERHVLQKLSRVMGHPNILKVAHNLPFEDLWTNGIMGVSVNGWHWCTMNGAHVLDCRKMYSGLKFQAYIKYGVEGYDKETAPLMTKFHEGTDINMLDTLPLEKLLRYGGVDSLISMWLYMDQHPVLTNPEDPISGAWTLTMGGLIALSHATVLGIEMDQLYYMEATRSLQDRMDELLTKIIRGKVAIEFRKITGKPLKVVNKDFSAGDLRVVLYDILGVSKVKTTATGLKSVDAEVVESIDDPWAKDLTEWRKMYKILNTYMAQFIREISPHGRMHPFFPMHTARTFRGSSTNPNFHNIPNRDEEAKAITRKGIMPSHGRRIAAVDFGSQEVRVAAILSQDAKLMWYCSQDDSDIHMDVTSRIWAADIDLITTLIRFHSKSGFVFAEIYGSFYVNCAVFLWEVSADLELKDGISLRQHLLNQGIISGPANAKAKYKIKGKMQTISRHLYQFIDHVKQIEKWFWGEFPGLREWQTRMVKEYQQTGGIEMPFGYVRNDLLNNNKIFNGAIQGTAFHILIWCYIELHKYCQTKWRTDQLGQIHDEIVYDMADGEIQPVLNTTEDVMTTQVRERYDWINVPLVIEPEVTDIDVGWYYKKPMIKENDVWVYKPVTAQ